MWGGDGPYSQVNLTIQKRILDDEESRTFLIVEVDINPTTFELVQEHIKEFASNKIVSQLVEMAEYRGPQFGYVTSAFEQEYKDEKNMQEAQFAVQYAKRAIVEMHRFMMKKMAEN